MLRLQPIRSACLAALVVTVASIAAAQPPAPAVGPPEVIRIWGHGHPGQDYILTLVKAWQDGFRTSHPEVRFEDQLDGNASAIGGLYTHAADLAILDREASFTEVDGYQQGSGHDPFRIPVARGSASTLHHAPALVIYVNDANPLDHLSVQQLDGIFDADHRLGKVSYKTWGGLGLTGDWATKPIHLYTADLDSADMQFFERSAMAGSQKFSCCLTRFHAEPGSSANEQIAAALSNDRFGIAVLSGAAPAIKPLALCAGPCSVPVLASDQTISAGTYPLARTIYIYTNRKSGTPLPPAVAAFLQFVVSPEGQAVLARTGGYLPLSPDLLKEARRLLQ